MSLRRQADEEDTEEEEIDEELFTDSESSGAEEEGDKEHAPPNDESNTLAAATERLRVHGEAAEAEEDADQADESPDASVLEEDAKSEVVSPSKDSEDSLQNETAEGELLSLEGSSEDSNQSAGSEVDITAPGEDLEDAQDPQAANKSEPAPYEVPVGKFWQHDDRNDEDANQRRPSQPRPKLWDKLDDEPWVHDRFDISMDEDDYTGFLARRGRGRGRGRGRRDGSETGSRHSYGDYPEPAPGYEFRGRARAGRRGGRGRRGSEFGGYNEAGAVYNEASGSGHEGSAYNPRLGFDDRAGRAGGRTGGSRGRGPRGASPGYGEGTPPGYKPLMRPEQWAGQDWNNEQPAAEHAPDTGGWGGSAGSGEPASNWPSLPSRPAAVADQVAEGWGAAPEPTVTNGGWGTEQPGISATNGGLHTLQPETGATNSGWGTDVTAGGWGPSSNPVDNRRAADSQPAGRESQPESWGSSQTQTASQPVKASQQSSGPNGRAGNVRDHPSAPSASGGPSKRQQPKQPGLFSAPEPVPEPVSWGVEEGQGGWDALLEGDSQPRASAASAEWAPQGKTASTSARPAHEGGWSADAAGNGGQWEASRAEVQNSNGFGQPQSDIQNSGERAQQHHPVKSVSNPYSEEQVSGWGGDEAPYGWGSENAPPAQGQQDATGWQVQASSHDRKEEYVQSYTDKRQAFLGKIAASAAQVQPRPQQPSRGALNLHAQEWRGSSPQRHMQQSSGAPGRPASLNARAQDFVPPGRHDTAQYSDSRYLNRLPPQNPSNQFPQAAAPLNLVPQFGSDVSFGMPEAQYQPYVPYQLGPEENGGLGLPLGSVELQLGMPFSDMAAQFPAHPPHSAFYQAYVVQAEEAFSGGGAVGAVPDISLLGYVPGPMQQGQSYGAGQPLQRPARRPITIEAPPDRQQENSRAGEVTGGRRYSAMSATANPQH